MWRNLCSYGPVVWRGASLTPHPHAGRRGTGRGKAREATTGGKEIHCDRERKEIHNGKERKKFHTAL